MRSQTGRKILVTFVPVLVACSGVDAAFAPPGPDLVEAATATAAIDGASADGAAIEDPFIFLFHDCVGPAGTPESFTAVKTELPESATPAFAQATAYRLTEGGAIFLALIRGTRHAPPGIDPSGVADTSCLVDTALVGTLLFSGFLTPASTD